MQLGLPEDCTENAIHTSIEVVVPAVARRIHAPLGSPSGVARLMYSFEKSIGVKWFRDHDAATRRCNMLRVAAGSRRDHRQAVHERFEEHRPRGLIAGRMDENVRCSHQYRDVLAQAQKQETAVAVNPLVCG